MISDHLQREALARARLDGELQLTLARVCLHLLPPWQMCRRRALRLLSGAGRDAAVLEAEWKAWMENTARRANLATRLLAGYRKWANGAGDRLAAALLGRPSEASPRARERRREKHQRHVSYWSRQLRDVQAVLDLEIQLSTLARDVAREAVDSLGALETENRELLAELDSAIRWLGEWPEVAAPDSFPPPGIRLLSADERVAQVRRRMSDHARSRLPATVETVEPRRPLPGWRNPWRELEPARIFTGVLDSAVPPIASEGFREAEAFHRAMVREIERAREVVTFGMESARPEIPRASGLVHEAVRNALSLLQYQRKASRETRPAAEAGMVRAQAVLFLECHLAFEKGRVGLLAHLSRQRGRQAARQARDLLLEGLREAARRTARGTRGAYHWVLLKIGWLAPPRTGIEPVSRRARLGEVLDLQLQSRDLPAIYRRLFRLAPVEEARFLVGREAELAGLGEALERWRSGLAASAVVVGARGSGKTSLLNCAVSGLFSGATVVRGQFSDRITDRARMRAFLGELLGAPEGEELTRTLAGARRVVMIEEFERTFLRVVNGFEALREFLDLMQSSARTTLWIVGVNETAFRYLDAATELGRYFSHRVNAMSVTQPDLTRAILQRHNLSGLRLEFAPLPEEDPRVSRARRLLGLEQDAQQLFFDALFQQSEGIFRAAFELWQGCIERVEGGVIHMRQPLVPNYKSLFSELTLDDYFTLQAILQHGGMTGEEHARVMTTTLEASRRRLERLEGLEILEPEPSCPGLRIRPEAGRFVRDVLHRQNLV
jgi:hypothetical protein